MSQQKREQTDREILAVGTKLDTTRCNWRKSKLLPNANQMEPCRPASQPMTGWQDAQQAGRGSHVDMSGSSRSKANWLQHELSQLGR